MSQNLSERQFVFGVLKFLYQSAESLYGSTAEFINVAKFVIPHNPEDKIRQLLAISSEIKKNLSR